jgi:RsiW-degrading membrane proteinase PrsW (M82 family)
MNPQSAIQTRKSILGSSVLTLVVLAVFVGTAYGLDILAKPSFSPDGLMVVGVVMALLPAIAWLFFFYQQDQREPEPKGMIAQVFILGGLLAMAIGIPLVEDVFHVGTWLYENFWVNLAGAILVIGLSQEFLKYAAVRFSVYSSAEFDERTDGIIYATAAGLGFATVLNVVFVVSSGGVNLGVGALRITLTALAQASFSGITGYFLSRQKFDQPPLWWMPAGVLLAALLNGIFYTVYGTLSRATISANGAFMRPWVGLVLAVILSVSVTGLLSWFIRRDQNRVVGKVG